MPRRLHAAPTTSAIPAAVLGPVGRPVSVCLEKTEFIVVAHSHDLAAGTTGIVAYGLEPTALLFLLVAAMRAWVTEENIQKTLGERHGVAPR